MSVPSRLKKVRESLGKTQKEMASLVGVALRTWQNYEEGIHKPSSKVMEVLAKLGFSANWIFNGEGNMRRKQSLREIADEYKTLYKNLPKKDVGKTSELTATGRMSKSMENHFRYIESFIKMQNEFDLEVGRLIRLINMLNYDNVFKLCNIVENMLDSQEQTKLEEPNEQEDHANNIDTSVPFG